MAILAPQFAEALKRVEPIAQDKKNAAKAHTEVREALERDAELIEMGIDTILIGSYARQVSIRRMRDVDVFSKLPTAPPDLGSRAVLTKFESVLVEEFGRKRVELQDRSVKVAFPDYDLSVDSVPAKPKGAHWQIPDRTDRTGDWEETNPEHLGDLTTAMNKQHDGMYVPTVKLIRQTRRTHLGDQPGGLYFEILTYHAFNRQAVSGPSVAEYYCSALHGVVAELELAVVSGVDDPTLAEQKIKTRATAAELQTALDTFRRLSTEADAALANEDRCRAAKEFQGILGKNDDGDQVLPMPEDCDDGGGKRSAAIVAGDRSVPAGDRRFA